MKTNVERVLDYLWLVGPQGATNAQIREATGIEHKKRNSIDVFEDIL